jgi:hypothetical protein
MEILAAAGGLFLLLAIFFLVRTFRSASRGRLLRASGAGISCVASLAVTAAAGLLLFSYVSYDRLTAEKLVSRIEFRRLGPDEFEARIMTSGELDRMYPLRGDEWQMDARIVSWTPPATILGLDPIYRLERISGRYSDIDKEREQIRTVHSLAEEQPVDIWEFARRFPILLPGVDAHYGTATYVPMADGARYEVSLTRTALIARPANDAARAAVGRWQGQR